jgi:hypothetical protein
MWKVLDKIAYLGFLLLAWAVVVPLLEQNETGVGKGLLIFGFAISVFGLGEMKTKHEPRTIKILTYCMLLFTLPMVYFVVIRLLHNGADNIALGVVSVVIGVFGVARSASPLWLRAPTRFYR